MEFTELLCEFERNRGYFPDNAIREALARREELSPHFLEILRDTIANAPRMAEDGDCMAHVYATASIYGWVPCIPDPMSI